MSKYIVSLVFVLTLLGAGVASLPVQAEAQTYGYYPITVSCPSITSDLAIGSRGASVSALQTFLVAQNYPGGGNWMITGYYGQATAVAVRNFQSQHGLPQTGIIDSATRAALCPFGQGGSAYNYNPFSYAPQNIIPWNYYQNPPTNYSGAIKVYGLSPTSGAVGTLVTVYGTGFSAADNAVRFGIGIIAGLRSYDGTTLSFTVPAYLSGFGYQPTYTGRYDVSASNSAGAVSNSAPFIVTAGSGTAGAPTITSVTGPTSLAVNTQGTWTISVNNNQTNSYTTTKVNWGDQYMYGASLSAEQTTYVQGNQILTFTHTYATAGTYTVTFTVTGVNGLSNTSTVTVNVGGSVYSNVVLNYLWPTSGHIGTQIQLQGSGFTSDNTVHFGNGGTMHVPAQNGTTLYFTVPSYLSPCDVLVQGIVCTQYLQMVSVGSYPVYVSNSNGTSQTINFSVN